MEDNHPRSIHDQTQKVPRKASRKVVSAVLHGVQRRPPKVLLDSWMMCWICPKVRERGPGVALYPREQHGAS